MEDAIVPRIWWMTVSFIQGMKGEEQTAAGLDRGANVPVCVISGAHCLRAKKFARSG